MKGKKNVNSGKAVAQLPDQWRLFPSPRDYFDKLVALLPAEWPEFPHLADAIAIICEARGAPILAHPGASLHKVGVTEERVRSCLDFGIAGLECYVCYHDEATTRVTKNRPT